MTEDDQVQSLGAIDFNNLTGIVNEPRTYGVQFRVTSEPSCSERDPRSASCAGFYF
jgi:hypothetical protein